MRYLLLFPFLFSFFVFSQGTDCSTAILVSSNGCSGTTAYTNTGITGNVIPTCFGTGNNNAMWFKFVASAPTVTITVNGAGLTQPMIALLDQPPTPPCTGTFPELSCTNVFTGTSASLTNSTLVSGNVYYIIVDGKTNTAGTFQLCLTSTARPVNDDPCNAIALQANNFCSPIDAYSNAGATGENLTSVSIPSCMETTSLNTVYFKYTAIGTSNTILINGSATGLNRPQASILSTTLCSGTTPVFLACSQAASGVNTLTLTANNLNPGDTYYILVDGFSSNTGAFQICVNSFAPTSTVVNDECSTATVMCPNNQYFATTKGATRNTSKDPIASGTSAGLTGEWQCNGVTDNTVWFSFFTTSPASDIEFSINSNCIDLGPGTYTNGGALQFEVFKRMGTLSACADRVSMTANTTWDSQGCTSVGPGVASGTLTIAGSTLSPNTQYFLIIDNYPDCGCDFNFIISGNQGTSAGADESKCLNAAPYTFTGFTPTTGGTWSGPGITNAATGAFSPASAGIGTHTFYYTNGNCTDSKVVTVTSPTVTVSNDVSICTAGSTNIIGNVTAVSTQPLSFTNSSAYTIPDDGVLSSWTGNATGTFASSSITPTGLVAGYTFKSIVLNIAHTWDGDVMAFLTNGCGTTIRLINSRGSSGDNFTNTTFTPSATGLLSAGSAPFTGTFLPDAGTTSATLWAAFCACQNTSAAWTLKVGDNSYITEGTLLNWTLNFVNNFPPPTYQWTSAPVSTITNSTSSLSQTVSPTVTTAYTLTATDYFGCVNTDIVNVTVGTPVLTITNPAAACSPATVNITAPAVTAGSTGGGTLSYWTDAGATSALSTPSAVATGGTYYIKTTSGSCSDIKPVTVTVNSPPSLIITNPLAVCSPATVDITATAVTAGSSGVGSLSYWSNATLTTSVTTPSAITTSGTYYIKAISLVGGCTDSKQVTVTVNNCSCPVILTTTDPVAVCSPLTVDLTDPAVKTSSSTGGPVTITYWTDAAATSSLASPSAVATGGIYYIKSDDGSCNVIKPVTVTINTKPNLSITNPVAVCSPNTVDITSPAVTSGSTGGGTLTYWSDAGCTSSLVAPSSISLGATSAVTYYIKSTTTLGACTDVKPVVVTINTTPVLTITDPNGACPPLTVDITAAAVTAGSTGGGALTYFNDLACSIPLLAPTTVSTSGTYYIKSTNVSCTDIEPVVVSISAPVLSITNPLAVCSPNTVDISAAAVTDGSTGNGVLSYWTDAGCTSTLASPSSISVGATPTVTYYIKSTSGICSDSKSVIVTINTTPVLTITNPATVCSPLTVDITLPAVTSGSTGNGTLSYWTNSGATTSLPNTTAITTSATYYIKSANGVCSDIKPVVVTITPSPSIAVTNPAAVCSPSTVSISNAGIVSVSSGTIPPLTYWTDAGATISLTTPAAVSTSGTYYFKATNGQCFDIQPVVVTINTTPSLTLTPPAAVCSPLTADLTAGAITAGSTSGGTLSYWTNAAATSSLGTPSAVSSSGTYYIKSNLGACYDIKSVLVTINTTPSLAIQDPSAVCFPLTVDITSPTVTLGSTGSGLLSYWTDAGATIPLAGSSAITTSGVYYIKSTSVGNCFDIKSVNVTVNSSPVLVITNPQEICAPGTVDLTDPKVTLGSGLGQISYCSNITGTSILTSPTSIRYTGTYYIKSTQNGCSTISPVNVTINPKPNADFKPTPPIVSTINSVSTMMNTSSDAVGYSWVFNDGGVSGETSPEHIFPDKEQSNQLVILIATSDKGCRDTTSKMVVVNEQLLYFVPNTFTPDGDDFNQTFKPIFTSGYSPTSYHLSIFDRWGELVFESFDTSIGWEGKLGKDGEYVQVGTYTWKIEFKLKSDDRRKEILGYVNILK